MAEKKKKKGLALWIAIGAVALAGLGVGGFFLAKNLANKPAETTEAPTTEEPTTEDVDFGDYQVFWNIDRDEYNGQSEIGLSSRTPDPTDGYYHILFAVDGRSVIRLCADKALVNKIEVERAMGLKFDDQGFIVDVIKIDEFTGGYAYDGMYVTSASETGELVLNSSALLDGMDFDAEFAENARVFDVSGALYDPGMEIRVADVNPRDRVVCINDKEGKVAYVFVTSRFITEPLYFNVERKYDSAIATTTREPNEDGLYEFLLAVNGEQKMFYTRSRTVATDIDKNSNFIVGLHFDAEGLISEVYAATKACGGGGYFGSWHWVEKIAGNQLSVARYSDDTHVTGTLSPDCRVFDVSGLWGFKGMEVEASSLNYWDQIIGFLDADKQIKYVFIMYRHVEGEVVFVYNKQYDSAAKVTKRVPDANGNYWYEVESGGTMHRYRVTDKDLATAIDGGASYIGIDLEGDRITKVYPARSRTGNYATGGGYTITEVLGDGKYMTTLISTTSTSAGATIELKVEPDATIVNMSTRYTSNLGEYTTLRLGDRVYPILDPYLKASYVFITSRIYPGFDIYARVSRQYNTTTKETTRKPDDEGFYNIPVSYHGKQMVLKTKDKAVATKIDAVSVPYLAIAVNGTTPYNADTVSAAWAAVGGVPGGYYYVTKKSGNTVTLRQNDDPANPGASSGFTMAADCEVYNIGGEFNVFGEATTIRVGDRVAAMIGTDSLAHLVYVVGRKGTVITKNCPVCGKEVQWTSFGGTFKAGVTHYYLAGDRTTVTQANTVGDLEVHFDLNGKTWTTEDGVRSLALYNENSTVRIFDTSKAKTGTIKPKKGAASAYGACLWLRYGSDKLYIDDVLLDFSAMDADNGYGAIWGPSNSYIELNNVRIKAGHTQYAAAVGSAGELVLNNVEITGGQVDKFGTIYIPSPGVLTLKGKVTVTGGTRTDDGSNANIFLAKGRKLYINGELTSAEGAIGIRMDSEDVFTGPDCATYASAFTADLPGGTIVTASGDALAIRFALSGIEFEEESISVAVGEAATVVVNQLPSPIEGTVITLT
ncbi:MAG: hypothetical protein J6Z38_03010, partial [Lachnospiraceae bacterium]|nr:hypothetical protein [Lachnospiraceae bacterium]